MAERPVRVTNTAAESGGAAASTWSAAQRGPLRGDDDRRAGYDAVRGCPAVAARAAAVRCRAGAVRSRERILGSDLTGGDRKKFNTFTMWGL